MGDVEDFSRGTDREVADWRTTLNNHTKLLNTIRDDVVDQGKKVDKLETEMRDGFAKVDANFARVDANFAKVDANFAKVEDKFQLLFRGQEEITQLLTRHLGEPDDKTRESGADE
jgi:hypothetical protein